MENNKAQVADALTWVVATLIIVIILIVFITITNILVKTKNIERFVIGIFSGDGDGGIEKVDIKTAMALEKNGQNRENIENWVKNAGP
ncbi:hypothetical protein HYT23_02795 [Candidatus Pacearchaeota archaeon]|nr:hypothetical protein [Candidatus Pacearchaeota archaeon]